MASEKTATLAPRTAKSAIKSDDSLRFLPWLFLAPSLVIYTIVVVYPMVYSSYLSLFRWDGVAPTKAFVGLDNYGILLTQNDVFGLPSETTLFGWSPHCFYQQASVLG
jgi:ABC-type sugar transport system permease subunit